MCPAQGKRSMESGRRVEISLAGLRAAHEGAGRAAEEASLASSRFPR